MKTMGQVAEEERARWRAEMAWAGSCGPGEDWEFFCWMTFVDC